MLESELMVGDVIFFMDTSGIPQHVAIYAGKRADTHFITHATSIPYNCIMTTRLKKDHFPYRVFRSQNLSLAMQAAVRMRIWMEHRVPFDTIKRDILDIITDMRGMSHPKTGGQKQFELAQNYFASKFYRYIEQAAHPVMPYMPESYDPTEGMRCSEAIATAFNIELLLSIDAVKTCDELQVSWISDQAPLEYRGKFLKKLPSQYQDNPRYEDYVEKLRSDQEYPDFPKISDRCALATKKTSSLFPPSLIAWNFEKYGSIEDFVAHFDFPLPLDAKITTPCALLACFQNRPGHWLDCGHLSVTEKTYPLEIMETNKEQWRSYVSRLFADAEQKQHHIRARMHSLVASEPAIGLGFSATLRRTRSEEDFNDLFSAESPSQRLTYLADETIRKRANPHTSPKKPPSQSRKKGFIQIDLQSKQ